MKILSIIGSPRKNGNTDIAVNLLLNKLNDNHFTKEIVYLRELHFQGCIHCGGCTNKTTCSLQDDMTILYQKMDECDLLILASPTYYYNVTSLTKKFIDRFFCLNIFDEHERSIWTSKYHQLGTKKAVTISICEQQRKEDIGFTTEAMKKPLEDIGFSVLSSIEIINSYNKGEVLKQENALEDISKTALIIQNNL